MNKNKKKPIKTLNKRLAAFAAAAALLLTPAHAAGLMDSKIVKGLINLINDLSTLMIVLSPLIATAVWGWCMARKGASSATDDDTDAKMWQKRATTALICGIAGMLGSAIITLISGYFI